MDPEHIGDQNDQNTSDTDPPDTSPQTIRLENFHVFRNVSHVYGSHYSTPIYENYMEPELDTSVYHNLVSRDYYPEVEWKTKYCVDWSENDTLHWVIDTLSSYGYNEFHYAYYSLKIPGYKLRNLTCEEIAQSIALPHMGDLDTRKMAEILYEKLHSKLNEDYYRQSLCLYNRNLDCFPEPVQNYLDLDAYDQKHKYDFKPKEEIPVTASDLSDPEDMFPKSELDTTSPEGSYGSDGSGDGFDKKKFKRPPGRPKGSGRKVSKRPKSASVPEFLRNLLLDARYCPSIIKWEDYSTGKFRFMKPDEVARLWGQLKNNDNMTFEKFSRAMRYHYKQRVLLSVLSARLVYQFGPNGPDYSTDNPNFTKLNTSNHINSRVVCVEY